MRIIQRTVSALVIGASLAASGAVAAVGDAADEAFDFRERIAEKGGKGVPFPMAEIICVTTLEVEKERVGLDVVFMGARRKGGEIWAIAGFEIYDLSQLWVGGPLGEGPATPPTAEWGWFYDRNGDGRVDWLTLVDTPRAVVPRGARAASLPSLFRNPAELTEAEQRKVSDNARLGYWHVADLSNRGQPDTLMALPTSTATGWTEGAMLLSLDGDTVRDCEWRSDHRASDRAACSLRNGAYETEGDAPLRADVPVDYLLDLYRLVTGAAGHCDFSPEGIERRP